MSAWVITVSDTRTGASDRGGPLIRNLLEQAGHLVTGSSLVHCTVPDIRHAMRQAKDSGVRVIILTGGTGLASSDLTIEAVTPMFQRTIDGFGELFRMLSFQVVGPAAMSTRTTAGVWESIIVYALPGSPAAAKFAMERLVLPEVGHLVREASR
ncbi:MAG: molybdenum cofactor biosynthesis protein MoaB [Myxococcaceae bacterium]|nr:molybdenum cofactor biosynthesis protein MoaB [Myxococcaceae bacterium]